MLMNRDLVCFILCVVFIVWIMGWFIWNIWLEDYFLFKDFKEKDQDHIRQEKIDEIADELIQRIENSEEMQHIKELRQSIDEHDEGDDD